MSPSSLEALEHDALEHLTEEEGHVEADLEEAAALASVPEEEPERSPLRLAVAMAFPAVAAAVMAGLGKRKSVWASRYRPPVTTASSGRARSARRIS